jgi:hypothetical protein
MMDKDEALNKARAVERGELPSGSVILPITGPNSLLTPGGAKRRFCFHTDESFYQRDLGYQLVRITENEPGCEVMGSHGENLAAVEAAAKRLNEDLLLTPDDVLQIRLSSMRASQSHRTYLVGLPVAVTVHDDGSVHLSVDAAEVGVSVAGEHDADADLGRIEAAFNAKSMTVGVMHQEDE